MKRREEPTRSADRFGTLKIRGGDYHASTASCRSSSSTQLESSQSGIWRSFGDGDGGEGDQREGGRWLVKGREAAGEEIFFFSEGCGSSGGDRGGDGGGGGSLCLVQRDENEGKRVRVC
ncbi:hypothetical protein M0804_014367 [Polistes exclamans]|nr:hypothetical protein M0804_014372 [Polistes exclamans]KAI4475336.1 hypothetical protein M0804_014367 [Polistes exclamans]